jgi:hypothetical protein
MVALPLLVTAVLVGVGVLRPGVVDDPERGS